MKTFAYLCSATIFIVATACNSGQEQHASIADNTDSFAYYRQHVAQELAGADSLTHFFKDSLVFNPGGHNRRLHFNVADESMWRSFQFTLYTDRKLYLYNFETKWIVNVVDFKLHNPEKKRMYCYVNRDTIYAFKMDEHDLNCFDLSGQLIRTIHFPDTNMDLRCMQTPMPSLSPFCFNRNNDMLMYMMPYLSPIKKGDREKEIKNRPINVVHFNKENIQIKNQAGTFPQAYLDHYYYDSEIHFTNINDSDIAYIFLIEPKIIVENVYTNKIQAHEVKGLPPNKVYPFTDDLQQAGDLSYAMDYNLKNDGYQGFSYDKDKKRFYLFRTLAIAPTTEDGSLSQYEDHPTLLYIIDATTFSVIHKLYCGLAGKYWYVRPIIYKNKLFLARRGTERKGKPAIIDVYDIP